jgi:WD40 repeat protein
VGTGTYHNQFAGRRGALLILDLPSGALRHRVELPWQVVSVDLTRDGRRAVVNGTDGFQVIDLQTGQPVGKPQPGLRGDPHLPDLGMGIAASPDGRLAAVARGNTVEIRDLESGDRISSWRLVEGREQTLALAWSPDSRVLVHGGSRGEVWLRSMPEGEPLEPARILHGFVLDLEVSPDGRWLASLGTGGDILLWDLAQRRPLGSPLALPGEPPGWGWLAWAADSRTIRASFENGTSVSWEIDPDAWIARACQIAHRDLTPEEWQVLRPGVPWRQTCGAQARVPLPA